MEKTLGTIAVGTLALIILNFLPLKPVAVAVAKDAITGVTGIYGAYRSSKHLYCYELVYKHKYIGFSYAKMLKQQYFYDEACTNAVPNSAKTLYGSWG